MRHTYATAALKAGVHLKILSADWDTTLRPSPRASTSMRFLAWTARRPGTIAALFVDDDAVSESVSTDDENGPSDDL